MTQPVADQTPIPERTYRRHTDPPGLWIAVALGSISLHLLLFWLLRSHGLSLLQKTSSTAIPIEFITISAKKTQLKASPKRQPTTPKPSSVKLPKQVAPKSSAAKSSPVEDRNAIAFTKSLPISINENVKPKNPKTQPKVALEPEPEPTNSIPPEEQEPESTPSLDTPQDEPPELTPSPDTPQDEPPEPTPSPDITETPEPDPTPSSSPAVDDQQPEPTSSPNLEENTDTTSQELKNQENSDRAFNPQNNTTNSSSPNPSPSETNNLPDNLPKTEGEVAVGKETPLADLAPPVQPQQSPPNTQQGGTGIASWDIKTDDERRNTPENSVQPIGKIQQKKLTLSSEPEPTPGPITFQATLLIDSNGNFMDEVQIHPSILEPQRSRYRKYALELFKDQKFTSAKSVNGNKREIRTPVVSITIQPVNSDQ
ncbi:hypothetical protein WA1_29310 [Scytonema hofmannii PCC 7110]|uniref:Uncharacterized protein n=1 Tax=Scytonema hofmannii PCC 7110 TaxID=128403 RepID=A0A139X5S0_9CYAN|nr:hypothetical protein [Scytonema hofmannii]KYC40057.1 hypothetical protein WA1_29310 [Scytonema hofmannii PCC 7110]